jgi:hypothetical protein
MKKATLGVGGLGDFAQPILGKPRPVSPAHPVLDKDSVQILNKAQGQPRTQPRPSQKNSRGVSGLGGVRQAKVSRVALHTGAPGHGGRR